VPRRLASFFGSLAGRLAYRRSADQRAVVRANLARVAAPIGERELDLLVERSYASYGRYWAEAACLTPRDAQRRLGRVTFEGREHLDNARGTRGVILALPHVGLWDAGGLWGLQDGFAISTVAERTEDPGLFAWFVERRRRVGLEVLAPGPETASILLRSLRAGGVVALLADRDVIGDGIEVPFFGAPAKVPAGPAVLALRADAVLVAAAVFQRAPGHVHIVVRPAIDTSRQGGLRSDVQRVSALMAGELAELIRLAPEQWHVFQPVWETSAPGEHA
jgi:lauroyl/myristoyl acyltransferase